MPKVDRLAENFRPDHYQLSIQPDFSRLNFAGQVKIKGRLNGHSSKVKLHAKQLQIKTAHINGRRVKAKLDNSHNHLILEGGRPLGGLLQIEIEFSGSLSETMRGLYASYFNYRGRRQLLVATQMEANHAREVFPCVDEPAAKAVFELTLKYPKALSAISNTPIKSSRSNANLRNTTFEATPKMSTYLLAFVIGNVKCLKTKSSSGVAINLYATPANVAYLEFAAEITPKILDFYEDYFGINYPLAKLDLIAAPDFSAGAMENWGLITYREEVLLVDPANSSVMTRQFVAEVIAHELAHQWFGNLVTMSWWTDLWLNEGFASWIQYLAVDSLFPEWQIWTQFLIYDYVPALELDSLANTHPVEVSIKDPAEIPHIFDAISYSKGACVIRMLTSYMGATAFRKGLNHYLQTYAYGSAATMDLWRALEKNSGKPVVKFMSAWTALPGHPVISYQKRGQNYQFHQQRFAVNPSQRTKLNSKTAWPVPLSFVHQRRIRLLENSSQNFKLDKISKLNPGQTHFYRVQYAPGDLQRIASKLSDLSPEDRAGLLLDTAHLAKAGLISTSDWLELLTKLRGENNLAVWGVMSDGLSDFLRVFNSQSDETIEDLFAPLGLELAKSQLERLGWEPKPADSHFDQLLRPIVLGWVTRLKDPAAMAEAKARLDDHVKGGKSLPADIRSSVYAAVARAGGAKDYQQLLNLYRKTDLSEEKRRVASALGQFKDPQLIKRSLQTARSSQVRLQEALTWVAGVLGSRYGKDLAWEWIQDNWDWLEAKFGGGVGRLGQLINTLGDSFADLEKRREIKVFLKQHPSPGTERNIRQALESIETSALWKKRDYENVLDWLKKELR